MIGSCKTHRDGVGHGFHAVFFDDGNASLEDICDSGVGVHGPDAYACDHSVWGC